MFRAHLCSSSGESIVIWHLVYVTLCRWPSSVQVWMELSSIQTCTLDGHLHRMTYTRRRINTLDSSDDEHGDAQNMQIIGINIYEKRIVRQVCYLKEMNRDAWSTQHKIMAIHITRTHFLVTQCAVTLLSQKYVSLCEFSTAVSASWLSYRKSTSMYRISFNGSVYGSTIRSFFLRNFLHPRLVLDCMSELQSQCSLAIIAVHEKCQRTTSEKQIYSVLFHEMRENNRPFYQINPLNPELNPICYLLALLGVHHFLHVSRIRVKLLTLRRLISYIYGAPILDVSRSHTTTQDSR